MRRPASGETGGRAARRFPVAPQLELVALGLARSPEAEPLDDERIVVLLFTLLIGPIVRPDPGVENQLITLEAVVRDCLAEASKGDEPQAGDNLACAAVLILAGVVVADQAEARVADVALGDQLRILCKISDCGACAPVHVRS